MNSIETPSSAAQRPPISPCAESLKLRLSGSDCHVPQWFAPIELLFVGVFLVNLSLSTCVNGQTGPSISTQPSNQTASLFGDATFGVRATGEEPLKYQWRLAGAELMDLTNASLTVTNVQRANAGGYDVIVASSSGSITSRVATLTITPFQSIYCFGYSWTDTHNCSTLWQPPTSYWHGRASNGPLWPELLSTNLGLTYVEANNYAHCGDNSPEILGQVRRYTSPPQPQLSVYFYWVGLDVNLTNRASWDQSYQTDLSNNSNAVSQLYAKGARHIVIQLHHDDVKAPGWVGTDPDLLSAIRNYEIRLNAGVLTAVNTYAASRPDLRIVSVNTLSKLDSVLAQPGDYGFTKTTVDALSDRALQDMSFTGPGAEYVYWDPGHGTTKLHELIAGWNLDVLTNSILEELHASLLGRTPRIQMNRLQIGRDYTLQKSADLTDWLDLVVFTARVGTNVWSDERSGDASGFYRIKWQR